MTSPTCPRRRRPTEQCARNRREWAALSAVWYDGTRTDIAAARGPLLAIGSPEVTITEDAWPAVYAESTSPRRYRQLEVLLAVSQTALPEAAIDLIRQLIANSPAQAGNYFLSSFGSPVRNEPPGGSAFPHRDALFYWGPGAGWNGPELTSKALGWVADFRAGAARSRQVVRVKIIDVDGERQRIGLSLRLPDTPQRGPNKGADRGGTARRGGGDQDRGERRNPNRSNNSGRREANQPTGSMAQALRNAGFGR